MLRLKVLGGISLERGGRPLSGRVTQRRRLALLVLLAAGRDRGVSRDRLIGWLWPERTDEQGRHSLSQLIYGLRQSLGEDVLLAGVDQLRLNWSSISSDVRDFADALTAGRCEDAVALYHGPFLDGFFLSDAPEFDRWVEEERARLTDAAGAALERLADDASRRGAPEEAVRWWSRRSALDPTDSRIALGLMRALVAAGDRPGAVQHAEAHSELLRSLLEVGPDPAVRCLKEQLRQEVRPSAPRLRHRPPTLPATPQVAATVAGLPGPAPPGPAPRRRRWSLAAAGATVGVLLLGAVVLRPRPPAAPALPVGVILADVSGQTGTLTLAIQTALRAELESRPELQVLSEAATHETLRLMRLPRDTQVTEVLACEIGLRRGLTVVLAPAISTIGAVARLHLRMLRPPCQTSGQILVREASDTGDLLSTVAPLTDEVAGYLGALPRDTDRHPLPAITTASLPALQNFVQARQALDRLDRTMAITLLQSALLQDSAFAMAHYLLGDQLWYVDRQRESSYHLTRALQLSSQLPGRERLLVRARYEQVVADRLDSALVYWNAVLASYPDEPLAHQGVTWTYRALGRTADVVAAADAALRLDPTDRYMQFVKLDSYIGSGDTVAARRYARSLGPDSGWASRAVATGSAVRRKDWRYLLSRELSPYARMTSLLALGQVRQSDSLLEPVRARGWMQEFPRALLLQAQGELGLGGSPKHALDLLDEASRWISAADLSPPAYGRLTEWAAAIAAQLADTDRIGALRHLLSAKDAGRGLSSYHVALAGIEASASFARGDFAAAARQAARARPGCYFGRSTVTLYLLEADALAALGAHRQADSLYQLLQRPGGVSNEVGDVWQVVQMVAERRRSRPAVIGLRPPAAGRIAVSHHSSP